MKTVDELAREAALQLYGTNHGTGQLDRPIAVIREAIVQAVKTMPDPYTENQAFLDWYEELGSGWNTRSAKKWN